MKKLSLISLIAFLSVAGFGFAGGGAAPAQAREEVRNAAEWFGFEFSPTNQ